jgi:hypothetical protein
MQMFDMIAQRLNLPEGLVMYTLNTFILAMTSPLMNKKLQFLIRKLEFNIPSIREEERVLRDEAPRIQEKFGKYAENISWWLQSSFLQNFI